MLTYKPETKSVFYRRAGGGVVDGDLKMYYVCPKCNVMIRAIMAFKTSLEARDALSDIASTHYQSQVVGSYAVVTTGDKPHGKRRSAYSSYYDDWDICPMVPCFEEEADVAQRIWWKICKTKDRSVTVVPLDGKFRLTNLPDVVAIKDLTGQFEHQLVMYDRKYLTDPYQMIAGDSAVIGIREWQKRYPRVDQLFLEMIYDKEPA